MRDPNKDDGYKKGEEDILDFPYMDESIEDEEPEILEIDDDDEVLQDITLGEASEVVEKDEEITFGEKPDMDIFIPDYYIGHIKIIT